MKSLSKKYILVALGVPLILVLSLILFWYATLIDETVISGSWRDFKIGDIKENTFFTGSKFLKNEDVFGLFYQPSLKFKNSFPKEYKNKRFHDFKLHDSGKVIHFYIDGMSFSQAQFKTIMHFDEWRFQWTDFFRHSMTFRFKDGKLYEIRKVRVLFSE